MPFVTKLRMTSGDRTVLDRVVDDIKTRAERKGAELKGPHSRPPSKLSVPQHQSVPPEGDGGQFGSWSYTVYAREMEIVGHESFARQVTERDFPDSIHVEVEIERRAGIGS
jgi:small subunit ribosomal protein S10